MIQLKNIGVIIQAVVLLRQQGFNATLRIVGAGPHESSLRETAAHLGLDDSVTFAGAVAHDEMQRAYQKADLYVQLSRVEGMSNSILEALASGLPIITTGVGGAGELMDGNGVVVQSAEPHEVAGAIRPYLEDVSLRRDHGRQSRQLARRFSLEATADRYVNLLSSIAAGT